MFKTLLDELINIYRKCVDYICILNDFNISLLKIYKGQCENINCVMQMDLKDIFKHANRLPSDQICPQVHYIIPIRMEESKFRLKSSILTHSPQTLRSHSRHATFFGKKPI